MYLGIDTSNYTTSVALFDSETHEVFMEKKLLPTQKGSLGLRQSDAVFSHIKQIASIAKEVMKHKNKKLKAIGVSVFPTRAEGSYMPCFLVGQAIAEVLGAVENLPVYTFSHQEGHIVSALYSADKLSLLKEKFIAFHISGGTTDALLITPNDELFTVTPVAKSLDLKAGQLVDRVGVMLNLDFPCGPELEKLALLNKENIKVKATMKGKDCCLSGVQNKCEKLLSENKDRFYISAYCLETIKSALFAMTDALLEEYGNLPLLYAGGVMSNSIIKTAVIEKYGGFFAKPQFSSDNSAGIAILSAIKDGFKY